MTNIIGIVLIFLGQFNSLKIAHLYKQRELKNSLRGRTAFQKESSHRKIFNSRRPESFLDLRRKGERNRAFNKFLLEEFPFDTSSSLGPAPGYQELPDIAFDGTNFFVAWDDDRTGEVYQIYGARVNPDGTLLDSFSIPISTGEGNRGCPAIAFDGTNYFVVWMDDRDDNWEFEIYGARVTPQGTVLDTQGIPISTGLGNRYYPSIAFDGTNYFVAWCDDRDGDWSFDIYGTRVTPEGQVLEPAGIPICTNPYQQMVFRSVLFGDSNYFLIWMDGRDEGDEYTNLYGARVRPDGVVLDPNGRALIQRPNNQMFPRLGFDGTNYFAVWGDDRESEWDFRVYGCRISQDGVVLDPNGILLTDYYSEYPAIDFAEANYLISYLSDYGIYGMRITPEGVVIDTGGFIVNQNYSYNPLALSFGQSISFVSFSIYGISNLDLYGARITTDGSVLDPEGLILAYGWRSIEQQSPVAAFDSTNYFIVWEDWRNLNLNIYGTRMTPSGEILDPDGIRITASEIGQNSPAIGYDGNNYFVVWVDYRNGERDIFGCRVTRQGVVLDSIGIQLSPTSCDDYAPAVAFDNTNYLVVWRTDDWASGKYKICGARITPDGQVLGTIEITSNEVGVGNPSITFGGQHYLVVWNDYRNARDDIYAARVSKAGGVLDPEGIPIDTTFDYVKQSPALSFDRTNYFVVYNRAPTAVWIYDVYGKRVNQHGDVLDTQPIPISLADYDQYAPSIDFNGTNYLVVWEDYRAMKGDIYGARVLPSGVVLDTNGIELINQPEGRYSPKVCCGPRTPEIQHLLAFSGYYSPLSAYKALGAFYLEPPSGGAENHLKAIAPSFQIYPNPIKGKGYLQLSIPADGDVKIALYSADGRIAKTLFAGRIKADNQSIPIETQNLSSGIYFINLRTKEKSTQKKILILKD